MQRFIPIAILAALSMSTCELQMLPPSLEVVVWPDGSGTVGYAAAMAKEIAADADANKDGFFDSVSEPIGIRYELVMLGAKFASIDKLKVGDMTFAREKRNDGMSIRVTIPMTDQSRWYKKVGPTAQDLELNEKLHKSWPNRPSDPAEKREPIVLKFKVALPGTVKEQRVRAGDAKPAWETKTSAATDVDEENEATLAVPLEDLRGGRFKEVVWEITCGPTLKKVEEKWEKFKASKRNK